MKPETLVIAFIGGVVWLGVFSSTAVAVWCFAWTGAIAAWYSFRLARRIRIEYRKARGYFTFRGEDDRPTA